MSQKSYSERLNQVIPGGAHTYSRGDDQYPSNAPQILKRGKGAYVYDAEENKFLDYGMALRAINLGYSEPEIDAAAIEQIEFGNNLTRASIVELEAAELFCDLIDSVDMVKFTKNGSTAVTAAVKLARAFTGRNLVARCKDHPFFSFDDWFIGSTPITRGIPEDDISQTKLFDYNDIESLEVLLEKHKGEIACVILEPSTSCHPVPSKHNSGENYLNDVQRLCHKYGVVFILDEMITGFRWHMKGAQHYYNVKPDLCTFGKAMANGFSVAVVAGKREIMSLGSIDQEGMERLFLLSTTHGAEMCSLGAFIETMKFMDKNNVIEHIWEHGKQLIQMMNDVAEEVGVEKHFVAGGIECSPYYLTFDNKGNASLPLRTLFSQEMIKNGVLMPWLSLSYSHNAETLNVTRNALFKTLLVYKDALNVGYENYLNGPIIKPVFRKFN